MENPNKNKDVRIYRWLKAQKEELIRLLNEGKGPEEIARILGKDVNDVEGKIKDYLKPKQRPEMNKSWNDQGEIEYLKELLRTEYDIRQILAKLSEKFPKGRTLYDIQAWAHRNGLKKAKEFDLKKDQMVALLRQGINKSEVARLLGVHPSTIIKWLHKIEDTNDLEQ